MSVAIITGAAGLVGSEATIHFAQLGYDIIGVDNDMRKIFFGGDASTAPTCSRLQLELGRRYRHSDTDVRNMDAILSLFREYGSDIALVLHTAAQPSHDWAARDPQTDFSVNANGTLNLLEATRKYATGAAFIFTSTNKVYGDRVNSLPFNEHEMRWEIDPLHEYADGIPETMSIDACLHSLFGASKVAADILVQEYGRYFGMKTACFRCGCLTGPNHTGTMLHGFLAYLMKCAVTRRKYLVFGYKAKQVRDNIHSSDLVKAFELYTQSPNSGCVYNIGGGRFSNCSMMEAIALCERITGQEMDWEYSENNRVGDHKWWISDTSKFKSDYPAWSLNYDIEAILTDIYHHNRTEWMKAGQ